MGWSSVSFSRFELICVLGRIIYTLIGWASHPRCNGKTWPLVYSGRLGVRGYHYPSYEAYVGPSTAMLSQPINNLFSLSFFRWCLAVLFFPSSDMIGRQVWWFKPFPNLWTKFIGGWFLFTNWEWLDPLDLSSNTSLLRKHNTASPVNGLWMEISSWNGKEGSVRSDSIRPLELNFYQMDSYFNKSPLELSPWKTSWVTRSSSLSWPLKYLTAISRWHAVIFNLCCAYFLREVLGVVVTAQCNISLGMSMSRWSTIRRAGFKWSDDRPRACR